MHSTFAVPSLPAPLFRRIALLVLLLSLLLTASTAYACGCGIYIPREGQATVSQEHALIRWDGTREDIVMSLGVLGSSNQAAIILPVPARAEVALAEAKVFDELDTLTQPLVQEKIEYTFNLMLGAGAAPPGAAAGARPVSVLSRQQLGPFDVANLAATDATALKTWLDENGFQLDPRIPGVLEPYVAADWTFVAVRVQPGESTATLSGQLAPLQITFDASAPIYPMRASALARNAQDVALYVLADHRVDKDLAFGESRVAFAGWVEPGALAPNAALAPYVSRKYFLTKFVETINPAKVHDDFHFQFASADTSFREVRTVVVEKDITGIALIGVCLAAMLAALAFSLFVVLMIRRGRAPRPA